MAKKPPPSFEQSLEKLEQLVQQIDSGELELAASLKAFEEGVQLIRHCQQSLSAAEQKIQMLTEENGSLSFEPLEEKVNTPSNDESL